MSATSSPLSLPSLRGGPLPLPQGERGKFPPNATLANPPQPYNLPAKRGSDAVTASTGQPARQGVSFGVVALLTALMFINYADRGSLSVAAPLLKDALRIESAQMGVLLSAFFWSYALAQPIAGHVSQRYNVKWVLAIGLIVWAGATLLCGVATGFLSLLLLRIVMGVGESVIFPANAHIFAEHAPNHQRGRYNAIISMGTFLGPSAGTLVGGLILASYGWQAVFIGLGALSLLWLIPLAFTPFPKSSHGTGQATATSAGAPGYTAILSRRSFWGISIGQFCYAYSLYLFLTWMPLFLVQGEHFSLTQMAWIGGIVMACKALGSILSGTLSDQLIHRGGDTTRVRKTFMVGGMALCAATLALTGIAPPGLVPYALSAAAFFSGAQSPMLFTVGQTLAGPQAGGRWMGLQNLIGNIAGIAEQTAT